MTTAKDDALDAAVRAVVDELRESADNDDRGVVTEWATVVHTASFDGPNGAPTSAYYILFSDGSLADHRACGLFDHGIYMVRNGEARVE